MEAWNKSLTWGLGGDQLRILDRKVEAILLAAESFDAVAAALGERSDAALLEEAWKHRLTSQSHDVGLCEYTRWQGLRMAPLDRVEDHHNFTWGAIGYDHLDAAQKQGQAVLDRAMGQIAKRINSKGNQPAPNSVASHVVTVLNPCGRERTDLALTGRIHSVATGASQWTCETAMEILSRRKSCGRITIHRASWEQKSRFSLAKFRRSDTTPIMSTLFKHRPPRSTGGVMLDRSTLTLENEHLRVRLDPACGAVSSLIDKSTGREMLDGAKAAVSHLHRQTQSQAVAPAAAAGELRQPHLEGEDRLAGNGPGAGNSAGIPRCTAQVEGPSI